LPASSSFRLLSLAGTVAVSIAERDFVRRRERLEDWLEDGTASFLGIAALRHGFDTLEKLGMGNIRR
jgi:molybdenum cofactor sulfurtransferase